MHYSPKIELRLLDVEVQKWPSYSTNGINPVVISTGFAYRFQ
jgi:outer membrane protein W